MDTVWIAALTICYFAGIFATIIFMAHIDLKKLKSDTFSSIVMCVIWPFMVVLVVVLAALAYVWLSAIEIAAWIVGEAE